MSEEQKEQKKITEIITESLSEEQKEQIFTELQTAMVKHFAGLKEKGAFPMFFFLFSLGKEKTMHLDGTAPFIKLRADDNEEGEEKVLWEIPSYFGELYELMTVSYLDLALGQAKTAEEVDAWFKSLRGVLEPEALVWLQSYKEYFLEKKKAEAQKEIVEPEVVSS